MGWGWLERGRARATLPSTANIGRDCRAAQRWVEGVVREELFPQGRVGLLCEAVRAVDGQLGEALASPLIRSADGFFAALYSNAAAVFITPAAVFRSAAPAPDLVSESPCPSHLNACPSHLSHFMRVI